MPDFIRGSAVGILSALLIFLSPGLLSARQPPPPGQSRSQGLFAVCDQASLAFLEKFQDGLNKAAAKGNKAGFDFFKSGLARIEEGFSNPGIELKLVGRWAESRPGRPDVFDLTALSGFVRSGKESSGALGLFLNPEAKGRHYRFYREVRARKSCLGCHGPRAGLSPEVRKLMKKRYPEFDGFDFKSGEVLGVVAVKVFEPPGNRPPSD